MSSDTPDPTPTQRLATAWNEISNAQHDLNGHERERITVVLWLLDLVIMSIQHPVTIDQFIPQEQPCLICGGPHG